MTQGLGRIVVAGNLSLDDTINPTGDAPDSPGGDALYAAVGVRLWGGDAWLLTLAGDDYPPAHFAQMHDLGIRTDLVRRVPGPTVHYRVRDERDGSRTYIHLTPEGRLAATSPGPQDYATLAQAAWLHLAAMPLQAQLEGVGAARRTQVPYSLDPHEEYVVGHEQTIATLAMGGAFMPSELELELLFPDLAVGTTGTGLALAAGAALDAWRPRFLAMKVGAAGSVVREGGRNTQVPADPVEVVDPIGAGDAYGGGFIVGYLATGSVVVGAASGAVAAAEVISRFGAFPVTRGPSREDLVERAAAVLERAVGAAAAGELVGRLRAGLADGDAA